LTLNDEFPVAKYKIFFKILSSIKSIPNDEIPVESDSSLKIINKEGKIIFNIRNHEQGLLCQGIFMHDSSIESIDDFLKYIHLSKNQVINKKAIGIMLELKYKTNHPGKNWSPFEPSIFSNLVLNNPIFSKFLKINDTDKISRNNFSKVVYYNQDGTDQKDDYEIFISNLGSEV
jgi:hypothetical protein